MLVQNILMYNSPYINLHNSITRLNSRTTLWPLDLCIVFVTELATHLILITSIIICIPLHIIIMYNVLILL